MAFVRSNRNRNRSGLTLLEVMITVDIVGILDAIAMPSYFDFVTRSKIIDGTTKLGDFQNKMNRYFTDNNGTYVNPRGSTACGLTPAVASPADYFQITCPVATASDTAYVIHAVGIAARGMGGFDYQVDQTGAKSSKGPAPWQNGVGCWEL